LELRLTVTITEYGFDPANGERFLEAFRRTHPKAGAVVDQDLATGRLSVTFGFDGPDDLAKAAQLGTKMFTKGASATGMKPTDFVEAHLTIVEPDSKKSPAKRELQPA
jgi:hypothetical protein